MADRRTQIGSAATAAIKRDGLGRLSFRTLAEEVGVKSASVHYHFPTKGDLAAAVIHDYTEAFRERLGQIDRQQTTLRGKIDALTAVFEDVTAANDLCLCGMMAAELTSLDERAQRALQRFFAVLETWLQAVFQRHAAELRSELPPAELARIFLAGLEGAALVDRVDGGTVRLAALRALARTLIG